MPLSIKVTLGTDTFEATGDFVFDAAFASVFRQWLNANDEVPGLLEQTTEQLERQTVQLETAIQANTLPPVNP